MYIQIKHLPRQTDTLKKYHVSKLSINPVHQKKHT